MFEHFKDIVLLSCISENRVFFDIYYKTSRLSENKNNQVNLYIDSHYSGWSSFLFGTICVWYVFSFLEHKSFL